MAARLTRRPEGAARRWLVWPVLGVLAGWAGGATAQTPLNPPSAGDLGDLVLASVRMDRTIVRAGQPVWAEFTFTNLTENRLTLRVPERSSDPQDEPEMGLPIEHVFSGRGFTGPVLSDDRGERHDSKATIKPRDKVPAIRLAPHGSVGLRLDLTRFYDSLRRPGQFRLFWQPYNAGLSAAPLEVTVLAERQAIILTDMGKITIRFYYDEAPVHVQNFIDLVEQRFYDKLTFNRIVAGGLIQGGDPLGNRRGVRPDGKRLKAEFSDIPFEFGTVGMARAQNDPDSASCQFFICLARQPAFDGQQTAFGYIVGEESAEAVRRIGAVPTERRNGMDDYPRKPVYIRAISLENISSREGTLIGRSGEEPRLEPGDRRPPPPGGPDRPPPPGVRPPRPGASQPFEEPAARRGGAADSPPRLPGLRAQGRVGPRKNPPASQPG